MSNHHTRILVVDDDPMIRAYLEQVLTEEGYRVASVDNGEQAIAALKSVALHLVITDLHMPGPVQSDDVVRAARLTKPHPPEVVVITGFADENTERRCESWEREDSSRSLSEQRRSRRPLNAC